MKNLTFCVKVRKQRYRERERKKGEAESEKTNSEEEEEEVGICNICSEKKIWRKETAENRETVKSIER